MMQASLSKSNDRLHLDGWVVSLGPCRRGSGQREDNDSMPWEQVKVDLDLV
jgi:hypothetical protein